MWGHTGYRPPRRPLKRPDDEETGSGLRGRLRVASGQVRGTLAGLPRVLRLVWGASRPLTIILATATILAGAIPAIQAYTTKLLINAVAGGFIGHLRHLPDRASTPIPVLGPLFHLPPLTIVGIVIALAIVQFIIAALTSLLQTLNNISQQLLQERVSTRVQELIMARAATLDLAFFEDPKSYDTLQQAQREATTRPVVMVSGTFGLARTLITFLSMIALLFGVSPWLAVIALVAPVPSFISDSRYGWRGYAIARRNSPVRRRMAYYLNLLTTDEYAKEVKIFTLGSYFVDRFRRLAQDYYDEQKGLVTRRYIVGYFWGALTTVASSGTYLFVALQAVAGRLTIGDLTLYTQAATQVQSSFTNILSGLSSMYEHNLYLTALFELLDVTPRVTTPAHPVPLPDPVRGQVEFQSVTFAYEGANAPTLEDVSFTIAPGETIAIVGRNGAGKTTLIKLLARLYDPTGGAIVVDGTDIRDYDPDAYRSAIGIMLQDYATYQAPARENIGLARLDGMDDMALIESAAERGGIAERVARLPAGYETMLGKWFDEGVNLSGGEWQKIALARAFIRDAPILILDEPTAALDAQAEFELFERLRRLTHGHTTIFISHRFSTVRLADRILVLEDGRLIEQGTHDELMRLDGRYARLFSLQASSYLDAVPAAYLDDDGAGDSGRRGA